MKFAPPISLPRVKDRGHTQSIDFLVFLNRTLIGKVILCEDDWNGILSHP